MADEWLTCFDCGCVDFVNIGLLSLLIKRLHDVFDDFFLCVGVVSGEDETCGSSHTGELRVVVGAIDLGIDCSDTEE